MNNSKKLEDTETLDFHRNIADSKLTKEAREEIRDQIFYMLGIKDVVAGIDFAISPDSDQTIVNVVVKVPRSLDFILTNIKLDSCSHASKRKEGIHTLFWVCNKCGADLGDVKC